MFSSDSTLIHLPSHPQWIMLSFGLEPHLGFSQLLLWLTPLPPSFVFSPQAGPSILTPRPDLNSASSRSSASLLPAPLRNSDPFLSLLLITDSALILDSSGAIVFELIYIYIFFSSQLSSNLLAIYALCFPWDCKSLWFYKFIFLISHTWYSLDTDEAESSMLTFICGNTIT